MKKIISTSKAQKAVFAIDHRLVECEFYRVSSASGHRSVLRAVRDAGHNPNPYDAALGRQIRQQWGKKMWTYVADAFIPQLGIPA